MSAERIEKEKQEIREFIATPGHLLCIGTTMSGKSHLVKWLIYCLKGRWDYVICISGTNDVSEDLNWCPAKFRYDDFDEELMTKIMDKQREYIKRKGKEKAPQCLIYIDDICGIITRTRGMDMLNILFSKGRHYNISVYALVQYACMLSPTIRANSRYYAITKIHGKDVDYTYDFCADGYENKKQFRKELETTCVDYNVIIYDTHGISKVNRLYIRAPATVNFKLKF